MGESVVFTLGLLAVALAASPAIAQSRALVGWMAELEACARFMEGGSAGVFDTGEAQAFPEWHLAYPGGGVCNFEPDPCLGPQVTFIHPQANGAATLTAADPWHGGELSCAHTPNPPYHSVAEHRDPTLAWIEAQAAVGRLTRHEDGDGRPLWAGCRENGGTFVLYIDFDSVRAPFFAFAVADRPARPCSPPVS